jgi:hypothetical protein
LIVTNITQETLYTFSRNKGLHDNGGGSGWSREGIEKFKEIYKAVKKDRKKQSPTFNQELLKMFQARRKRESGRGSAQVKSQVDNRKRVVRCINEFNDSSDSSDDDDDDDDGEEDEVFYKSADPINPAAFLAGHTGYDKNEIKNKTEV